MNEENINKPFKNGDIAICVCEQAHKIGLLTLGQEYEVLNADEHFVTVKDDEGQSERYNHERFVLKSNKKVVMEQTAERIREDILHIEKRIEEAEKDITSMEQEKNALIEKLKEKGFILLSDKQSPPAYVRPSVGDLVRVIRVDEDYDEGIYLGYEFVIKRDDGSCLPYMDDCCNWFREDSVVKI